MKDFQFARTKEIVGSHQSITDADIANADEWLDKSTARNRALKVNLQAQLTEHLGNDRATELLDMMAQESRERMDREMKKYQAARED